MGEFSECRINSATGMDMKKGERLGNFNLGSSVVLVFEAPENFQFAVEAGRVVKYGEALGSCSSSCKEDG